MVHACSNRKLVILTENDLNEQALRLWNVTSIHTLVSWYAPIVQKVDRLENEISAIKKTSDERAAHEDERNACIARQRILRFGDEVRHGQNHSEEHYNDILEDITSYESYCDTHPNFKNQKAQSTIKIIVQAYEGHMKKNDFLVWSWLRRNAASPHHRCGITEKIRGYRPPESSGDLYPLFLRFELWSARQLWRVHQRSKLCM